MNPLEDYLQSRAGKEKTAIFSGFRAGVGEALSGQNLARTAVQGAVVGAGIVATEAAAKAFRAMTKRRDFEQMMKANPDLAEHQRQNPLQFNQHYNSLRAMNPQFASEPTVAGTYMRQMSLNPESAGKAIVESLQARKGVPATSVDIGLGGGQVREDDQGKTTVTTDFPTAKVRR